MPLTQQSDHEVPLDGEVFYYMIAAVNSCGEGTAGFSSGGAERAGWAACEPTANDYDEDGIPDLADNCPTTANPGQSDSDQDFIGDLCDTN